MDHYKEYLKDAKLITLGRGGWTAYINSNEKIMGYGCDDMLKYLLVSSPHNIPIIDTRDIHDDYIVQAAVRAPLPVFSTKEIKHKFSFWGHDFGYKHYNEVIRFYQRFGATIYNRGLGGPQKKK